MFSFYLNKGTNLAGADADKRSFTKSETQLRDDACRLSYIGETLLKLNFDTDRGGSELRLGPPNKIQLFNLMLQAINQQLNNLTTWTRWQRKGREDLQILWGMETTYLCFHLFSYFGLRGSCTKMSVCDEQAELDWFQR